MIYSKHRGRFAVATAMAIAAALLVTALAGCGTSQDEATQGGAVPEQQASTQTVTDMVGRTVEVPAKAEKVIGIGSSSLRLIAYLEAVDTVVGVEQSELEDNVTCSYRHVYHDTLKNLPVIGDGGSKGVTPNEEAIMQAARIHRQGRGRCVAGEDRHPRGVPHAERHRVRPEVLRQRGAGGRHRG